MKALDHEMTNTLPPAAATAQHRLEQRVVLHERCATAETVDFTVLTAELQRLEEVVLGFFGDLAACAAKSVEMTMLSFDAVVGES